MDIKRLESFTKFKKVTGSVLTQLAMACNQLAMVSVHVAYLKQLAMREFTRHGERFQKQHMKVRHGLAMSSLWRVHQNQLCFTFFLKFLKIHLQSIISLSANTIYTK
jgi:hypothetical protein